MVCSDFSACRRRLRQASHLRLLLCSGEFELTPTEELPKECGSSWIFVPRLTRENALQRVQFSAFFLVSAPRRRQSLSVAIASDGSAGIGSRPAEDAEASARLRCGTTSNVELARCRAFPWLNGAEAELIRDSRPGPAVGCSDHPLPGLPPQPSDGRLHLGAMSAQEPIYLREWLQAG
jgi:hypothetical protein